jgi:serine/threonine protein phosphatase PrpC
LIRNGPGFLVAVASDTGKQRKNNEDSWLIRKAARSILKHTGHSLFAVADGIGGSAAGEVASQTAVTGLAQTYFSLPEKSPQENLRIAIYNAHQNINEKAQKNPEYAGMGSTITALVLDHRSVYLAHVGDSRAYIIRDNQISQLTTDQTVTADLVAKGKITAIEAQSHPQRHILVQAMGGGRRPPEPVLMLYSVRKKDVLIMCTDGLYNLVNDEEIKNIAVQKTPQTGCEQLVQLANERGGTDNITVMIIKIVNFDFLGQLGQLFQRVITNARNLTAILRA